MILLPTKNQILEGIVLGKFEAEKREIADSKMCDFDNVSYRVMVNQDELSNLYVSMNVPFWHEIENNGGEAAVQKFYGDYAFSGDENVNLKINLDEVKDNAGELAEKIGNLKTNVVGAVYRQYFDAIREGSTLPGPSTVHLRDDTTIYFVPKGDRVIIIYALDFIDKTDRVIAHVLLNEFAEARRNRAVGSAPIVNFSPNPPLELQEMNVQEVDRFGFVSFAILKSHVATAAKSAKAADALLTFRNYIQYHIKCSKAHFHQRMRARVKSQLQVLNRAKTEKKAVKKIMGGKTWKGGQ